MKRLYVVVRSDLPSGLQMAQACHAALEFGRVHGEREDVGDNLVVLHARDEQHLKELTDAGMMSAALAVFREPDLGNEVTAVSFNGDAQRMLSSLPLARFD